MISQYMMANKKAEKKPDDGWCLYDDIIMLWWMSLIRIMLWR